MTWKKVALTHLIHKPLSGEWGTGEGNIKVLRTTNFTNTGDVDFTNVVNRNIEASIVARKKLLPGDIIIEKSGGGPKQPVGRVVFFNKEGIYLCNNFTSILRPVKEIDPKFLFWKLFAAHQRGETLRFQNKTTGIINLKLEKYTNELKIPLPPLHIQQQIADTLDKADALRQKDQQLLQKYDELAQSIFYDMFGDPVKNEKGWLEKSIDKVCKQIVDCVNRTAPVVETATPYKMIRTSNVKNGKVDINDVRYVDEKTYLRWVRRLVPEKGDIIFTREAPVGEAGIIETTDKVFLGQRTMLYRPNIKMITSNFLLFQILGDKVQKQIGRLGSGSTVKHLSVPDCKKFTILCPPLKLQIKFEEVFARLVTSRSLFLKGIRESEYLFKSLLQTSFDNHKF